MSDDEEKRLHSDMVGKMTIYLCLETGITEAEARSLIRDLGIDKNSLLREAREIRRSRGGPKQARI